MHYNQDTTVAQAGHENLGARRHEVRCQDGAVEHALFPLESVGRGMRLIARIDPFAYGVDGLRAVIGGSATQFGVRLDLTILATLAFFLIGLSSRMFSKIQI